MRQRKISFSAAMRDLRNDRVKLTPEDRAARNRAQVEAALDKARKSHPQLFKHEA